MAKSFFPQLSGSGAGGGAVSGSGPEPSLFTSRGGGGLMRRLLPGLILGSGGAALAVVFAGLWWRGEDRVLQAEQERDAAVAELTRASGAQARDRQSRTVAMVSSDEQLTRAHQEVSGLRRELEKAQAAMDEVREALAQAGKERDELSDQLSWQSNAGQQSQALLETERGRSETLALNLSQAQTELSSRAALHEQDVEELRSNVVSLRDEAAYRDIEVTNLISRAENQISSSQDEARQLQWKATDLESQLNSANAENTRLQSQVSSLESDLYTARQENVRLAACVERLECEVKILEKQLAQAIAAAQTTSGSGQSQSGGSGGASVAGHGG